MTATPDPLPERIVVGSMLDHVTDEAAGNAYPGPNFLRVLREVADTGIRAGDFWFPRTRYAFGAVMWCLEHNQPVTEQNVQAVTKRSANPEHLVPIEWLFGLMDDVVTTYGVAWYAQKVVDAAKARRVAAAGEALSRGATPEQVKAMIDGVPTQQAQTRRTIGL